MLSGSFHRWWALEQQPLTADEGRQASITNTADTGRSGSPGEGLWERAAQNVCRRVSSRDSGPWAYLFPGWRGGRHAPPRHPCRCPLKERVEHGGRCSGEAARTDLSLARYPPRLPCALRTQSLVERGRRVGRGEAWVSSWAAQRGWDGLLRVVFVLPSPSLPAVSVGPNGRAALPKSPRFGRFTAKTSKTSTSASHSISAFCEPVRARAAAQPAVNAQIKHFPDQPAARCVVTCPQPRGYHGM